MTDADLSRDTPDGNAVAAAGDVTAAGDAEFVAVDPDRVRTLFVSDIHLGCEYARADDFLTFLEAHRPEAIYLVGDFVDGWRLKKRWYWIPTYDAILTRLIALADGGTRLCYTPGNHDEFLRTFPVRVEGLTIKDEFVHRTADGRRLLVIHGDRFDKFEQKAKWISVVLTFAYDWLLWANRLVGRSRGKTKDYSFSSAVKTRVKGLARFFSDFERSLARHARDLDCGGVVCGHIHKPSLQEIDDTLYLNTGDWIEHATALVEYDDGRLELVEFDGARYRRLAERAPDASAVAEREPSPGDLATVG